MDVLKYTSSLVLRRELFTFRLFSSETILLSLEGELSLFKALACQWGRSPENGDGRRAGSATSGILERKRDLSFFSTRPRSSPAGFSIVSTDRGAWKLATNQRRVRSSFSSPSRHWVSWDASLKTVCETIGESFLSPRFSPILFSSPFFALWKRYSLMGFW